MFLNTDTFAKPDQYPISEEKIDILFKQLHSSKDGIPAKLAKRRFKVQQKNNRTETQTLRELKLFFRQFSNPLVLILVIVAVLSALLNQQQDVLIILLIIIITGLLGFVQEYNAGRAAARLTEFIKIKHSVQRLDRILSLNTEEIVPGDVLLLQSGDIIPADCRLLSSLQLFVNESSLTGESYPAEKYPGETSEESVISRKHNCLWRGTSVISGTAKALVVYTGNQTILGRMARKLQKEEPTAFERGVIKFGYFLLRITAFLSAFILLSNLYFGRPFFNSLMFSLALAIGMAPELLPAITTFTMSAGAKKMVAKKVIVKKLSAVFNLGEVNILCTDKTGTITEGSVRVNQIVDAEGHIDEWVRTCAFLNSSNQTGFPNSIDTAITSLSIENPGYQKIAEIPYDFLRKRLSIGVTREGVNLLITKGAVKNILEVCKYYRVSGKDVPLEELQEAAIHNRFTSYCQNGFRVLAVASKVITVDKINRADEKDMIFLGFILLDDPVRSTAPSSIRRLGELNVAVKIITGDNQYSALHVAGILGIQHSAIITGDMLNTMSPESFRVKVCAADIFAEIEPHQKERIIKTLQNTGRTVAYLGDGINDVAAMHAADAGLSTSNAADVAKEAADFVLMEKDLGVVADGIYEGRRSFANSIKYIYATTGSTFGNMFSVAAASLALNFLPMLPKHILLANLITDLPFLAIAYDKVSSEQLNNPVNWNIRQIRNFMIVFGLHSSLFDMATFYIFHFYLNLPPLQFQSAWFMESVLTELLILFVIRSPGPMFSSLPAKGLLMISGICFIFTIALPFLPISRSLSIVINDRQVAVFLFIITGTYIFSAEFLKLYFFKPPLG